MKPSSDKPGTAVYEIPKGRQLATSNHRYGIIGPKKLNHLDVEDAVVYLYERLDW